MAEAYVGEIRAFGFNFMPSDWLVCDGSLVPIRQYTALYSLLGTRFGGDGQTNFGLPDLRSRAPIGMGQGPGLQLRTMGESGGAPSHVLTQAEVPSHSHALRATPAATTGTPGPGTLLANTSASGAAYQAPGVLVPMAAGVLSPSGGNDAHENRQPYLGLNFGICTAGEFPPRS